MFKNKFRLLIDMRIRFWEVFEENPNGSISPRTTIKVGGVILSPGVSFTKGVTFGGVDFFNYYGMDLEVDNVESILVLRGFYTQ